MSCKLTNISKSHPSTKNKKKKERRKRVAGELLNFAEEGSWQHAEVGKSRAKNRYGGGSPLVTSHVRWEEGTAENAEKGGKRRVGRLWRRGGLKIARNLVGGSVGGVQKLGRGICNMVGELWGP